MDISVIVVSVPPYGFYAATKPGFLPDMSYRRLLSVPNYRSRLNEAEIDSGSIELDNSDGLLSGLFSNPPLGVSVGIYESDNKVISGIVVGMAIQRSSVILRLEA